MMLSGGGDAGRTADKDGRSGVCDRTAVLANARGRVNMDESSALRPARRVPRMAVGPSRILSKGMVVEGPVEPRHDARRDRASGMADEADRKPALSRIHARHPDDRTRARQPGESAPGPLSCRVGKPIEHRVGRVRCAQGNIAHESRQSGRDR